MYRTSCESARDGEERGRLIRETCEGPVSPPLLDYREAEKLDCKEGLMRIGKSGLVLWGLYGVFALSAVAMNVQESTFQFSGQLGAIKALVWLALFMFLGYSLYCSLNENFFRSVRSIATLHWGRQIGIDLYLGLFVSLLIIFLNEGALIAAIWLVPILIYANLVVLLYLAINFDTIVTKLLGL